MRTIIKTRVVVVDDHEVVREGLVALLGREQQFEIVGAYGTAEAALLALGRQEADVVVLDHRLPGMSGAAACREIKNAWPSVSVIILTSFLDDSVLHASLAAGASGFLLKGGEPADLTRAIREVAGGGSVLAPEVVGRVIGWACRTRASNTTHGALTPREVLGLSLAARGLKNREISRELDVSEGSVKTYLRTAAKKLGVEERSGAVAEAIRRGII